MAGGTSTNYPGIVLPEILTEDSKGGMHMLTLISLIPNLHSKISKASSTDIINTANLLRHPPEGEFEYLNFKHILIKRRSGSSVYRLVQTVLIPTLQFISETFDYCLPTHHALKANFTGYVPPAAIRALNLESSDIFLISMMKK